MRPQKGACLPCCLLRAGLTADIHHGAGINREGRMGKTGEAPFWYPDLILSSNPFARSAPTHPSGLHSFHPGNLRPPRCEAPLLSSHCRLPSSKPAPKGSVVIAAPAICIPYLIPRARALSCSSPSHSPWEPNLENEDAWGKESITKNVSISSQLPF